MVLKELTDLCRGRHDIYDLYPMPSLRSTWGYANHPSSTEQGNITGAIVDGEGTVYSEVFENTRGIEVGIV